MMGCQRRQILYVGRLRSQPLTRCTSRLTEAQGALMHYGLAARALVLLGLSRSIRPPDSLASVLLDGVFTPIANLRSMCDAVVKSWDEHKGMDMSTNSDVVRRFQELSAEAKIVESFRDPNIDASVIVFHPFQKWAISVLSLFQDALGRDSAYYVEFERLLGIAAHLESNYITQNHFSKFLAIFESASASIENGALRRAAVPLARELVSPDKRKVFIIHGRNVAARVAIEHFVKALDLVPIDFDDLAADQGGSAFIGDIVRAGLTQAQGIIALFTPDEFAALRTEYRGPHDRAEDIQRWQARPNVLFEAGMAYGMDPGRTILVTLGTDVALFSDVSGIHVVRLTNQRESRSRLRNKLIGVKCDVNQRTDAWSNPARSGDFETCVNGSAGGTPRDPFLLLKRT